MYICISETTVVVGTGVSVHAARVLASLRCEAAVCALVKPALCSSANTQSRKPHGTHPRRTPDVVHRATPTRPPHNALVNSCTFFYGTEIARRDADALKRP